MGKIREEKKSPGGPGIVPRWTSSAKIGVGTALSSDSNIWFTISHGIINEVYFPRIDTANTRDLEFIVTDGKEYFCEEKRSTVHEYNTIAEGVPAYHLINTCKKGRFRIQKRVIADPRRNVLLQEVTFEPLVGNLEDYHLYLLIAPHVQNAGYGNSGWTGNYKGQAMLFAKREGVYLACSTTAPFIGMNCGYVGDSDPWQDLHENKKMTYFYSSVEDGNIALAAEIDLKACGGRFVQALGFGFNADTAGIQTRASLHRDFSLSLEEYIKGWQKQQHRFAQLDDVVEDQGEMYRTSLAVIKTHQGKHFNGSVIASLSIPWGTSKGDNDIGGYHLIWPRDQVLTAEAFLAAGDIEGAREVLLFLICTQEASGRWMQCMWGDGASYWSGLQMDEVALPILLADHLKCVDGLRGIHPWKMISKAAAFILQNGPITEQDRWEENAGITPFTLATEIAALLAAADFFEGRDLGQQANYLRETADWWNANIENWLYVTESSLCNRCNVEGHYVRVTPKAVLKGEKNQNVQIKNRPEEESYFPYQEIVSVDALALVRFGLRSADDPRIRNTVEVIDQVLKTNTAKGPIWHRYNEDGYGEHADGSPYNGTGIGRGWPLLSGERGHYELARGKKDLAEKLLEQMATFAGEGGLLPEQIWDAEDIPEKTLYNGHSAGSAKPLVWAHAEFICLLRSIKENRLFHVPAQTVERYLDNKTPCKFAIWTFQNPCKNLPKGMNLRIQTNQPATIRWSLDNWKTETDAQTQDTGMGVHYFDIPWEQLQNSTNVVFTFFWNLSENWEGENFEVTI